MNVPTTRPLLEPWAWSPATVSIHVGGTLIEARLTLSDMATTSSKSNIVHEMLIVNTHTNATGLCLVVTAVRTMSHFVCAQASLSFLTVLELCTWRLGSNGPLLRRFILIIEAAS